MILTVGNSVKDDKGHEYILDEIIGQGGFGYVFKAHRKGQNSVFAIKTMLPSFENDSAEQVFKNEIMSSRGVKGDNIIRYEYVHNGDDFSDLPPYIIMEFADGGTLNSILKQKKKTGDYLCVDELVCIFKQLSKGMDEINKTLIHRDIKPDNILLCEGVLKISDFGLSKIATENTRTLTYKGGGTPLYMAPEAWDYTKNTIQMDIYSMGIVFYELATLKYPYEPIPRTYEECKRAHLHSIPLRIEQVNPSLPASLISVINRMIEKPISKRFTKWDEIIFLLNSQNELSSTLDKMVDMVVSIKNKEDNERQKREVMTIKNEQDKKEFCELIHSQFERTIATPIVDFVDKINSKYAGKDKISFIKRSSSVRVTEIFSWELIAHPGNKVLINMEAIIKENHQRTVVLDRFSGDGRTKIEYCIPEYKGKKILAWGEVINNYDNGFNLLLLDNGSLYGDWLIMNNKNNLSFLSGKERREPFSFDLEELSKEIASVQVTHLYSSEFKHFDETDFLNAIKELTFDTVKQT